MPVEYSVAQKNRLSELGCDEKVINEEFEDAGLRQKSFMQLEKSAVRENKEKLRELLENRHRVELCILQDKLAKALCGNGFTQITTPIMITAKALEKMTIDKSSPLFEQVFWLDHKTALRPMLAPNLYEVSRQLITSHGLPLRIFEIGSCFRKESEGRSHLKEFTMLNLVEWGTAMDERTKRLKELAGIVMEAAGIDDHCFENENSVVYGEGLDVVSPEGLELASTSMGPHKLDDAWKITCTWVGLGTGLERLLMHREQENGIHRYSKSTVFLDGACMKLK